MFQKTIFAGNRAAVIRSHDEGGPFSVRIWVNARDGLNGADATLVTTKRATLAAAIKWAENQLTAGTDWVASTPAQMAQAARREMSGFVNADHD